MSQAFDALTLKVLEEVEACIGCNDCMLACPVPEKAMVTIAQLNATVYSPLVDDPMVEAFLGACTQCQQCVPVCPADLSRADMVLLNKQKVEDIVPDKHLRLQRGDHVEDSDWTLDALAAHLGLLQLFAGVDKLALRRMLLSSTLLGLDRGDSLLTQGAYQERLLVIVSGVLRQHTTDEYGEEIDLISVGEGSFLGEMAVLADRPEPYSVTARTSSIVVAIPKATIRRLMESTPTFKTAMDRLHAERALSTYAARSAVLGALPVETHGQLLAAAQPFTYRPGEIVQKQDETEGGFTMVLSGFLKVSQSDPNGERVLLYYREGDDFGGLSILEAGWSSRVTIRATTVSHVLRIPAVAFKPVFAQYPGVKKALTEQARAERDALNHKPRVALHADDSGPATRNTTNMALDWESMLEKGLLKGHRVLAIDQTRCTDCNNCVDACGRRHGIPRLERRGLQLDNLLFPAACRHCDDPVCLLCSVNGIVRKPDGEIAIVDDTCIGCGGCADRCPYDNIVLHQRETPKPKLGDKIAALLAPTSSHGDASFLDKMFGWLRSPEVETDGRGEDWVAVKCDLCAGYKNEACVTACPTGAAFRFDPITELGENHIGMSMQRERGDE